MGAKDQAAARFTSEVRRYYDHNTARFEQYGQGGASIHRAVWGPGVETRKAAVHYVDDLILSELRSFEGIPRVLDLGCGLGETLLYLASQREVMGEGITISPVQASRATERVQSLRLGDRIRCREGDFLALPGDLGGVDLAFSIEAFVHSPDSEAYFREAGRVLRRGGKLIICDDFLASSPGDPLSKRQERWLEEFRRGWHVGSLIRIDEACRQAEAVGLALAGDIDLTSYLELARPRDRLIGMLVAAGRHLPIQSKYWHMLLGGRALQKALLSRVLAYRFVVFERR